MSVRHVGIMGGGLIGMSWASLFLARGIEVTVVDPRPAAGAELAAFIAAAWPHLRALGLTETETPRQAAFSTDVAALARVDYLQENGPDRIAMKEEIVASLEAVIGPEVVIASSTSSLMASDIQAGARHPERILVAHPMNPPHLVPMVELVAGRLTAPDTVDRAEAFYLQMQRVPIRVKKEVPGHLANRLTSALYREAVHMVAEGIADVGDIDKAIAAGPGMRWALMGPHLIYHLGGGAGGYRHYLDHLGPTQEARWSDLGQSALTEELKAQLVGGVEAEIGSESPEALAERRDAALVALAALKRQHGF
ncbi:3-hydroxyacyl-CoA dehydrogenase NAD-binding domain-containing protein [Seohaeicola zhoushanensis]|uniref:Hydroxyacyl-CoA dehydrogenase n=1 Tax=Seohaeicola zhoushanensis TaxID=1569283 RepID=A0A8J3GZR9_9RHOB|nr:3-hydroxyacyl-CoA dehydrogenase NAD-binding domain-containing protein [Seohaeicola zhoushanensis]GHF57801.1 hydroxyacyl-CoA dehydrogenase [Seohaeicola zhoushanensis]